MTGLSLRVGIAIMVIFITQLLLRLYRYCLRIGNFYMSRFDALLCYEPDLEIDLDKAINLFTPPVEVGKEPPSPSEIAKVRNKGKKAQKTGTGTTFEFVYHCFKKDCCFLDNSLYLGTGLPVIPCLLLFTISAIIKGAV